MRGVELAEARRQRARRELAELVTADAAHVLHPHQVLVAPVAQLRGLLLRGQLHHRVPVGSGVHLRGGGCVGRGRCRQVHGLARLTRNLCRISKAISPHPHLVLRRRQIGNQVAALIVSDDDLREARWQIARLRDDPHARFGAGRRGNDTGDVVGIHRDRRGALAAPVERAAYREGEGERAGNRCAIRDPVHAPIVRP